MTFGYNRTAATGLRLLTRFGKEITRRAVSAGAYDPSTGAAALTPIDTTRIGAVFPFGAATTTVRGEMVRVSDQQLLLDAEGVALFNDRYLIDGVEYSVVSVAEWKPADRVVLYDIHLRAGA